MDTPGGEWYYASLCGRRWRHENKQASWRARLVHARPRSRIQKVECDGDGWPYVVGGHEKRYVEAPADAIATEAPTDQ